MPNPSIKKSFNTSENDLRMFASKKNIEICHCNYEILKFQNHHHTSVQILNAHWSSWAQRQKNLDDYFRDIVLLQLLLFWVLSFFSFWQIRKVLKLGRSHIINSFWQVGVIWRFGKIWVNLANWKSLIVVTLITLAKEKWKILDS